MGDAGKLIGTITALAESDLYMQANANNPLSLTLPHDRVGSDKDSLGLYQQRTKWWFETAGDSEDERVRTLMDATRSSRLFFAALQRVPNWQALDPWVAAQAVQRSGTADGSNYKARMAQAQAALAGGPNYFTRKGRL